MSLWKFMGERTWARSYYGMLSESSFIRTWRLGNREKEECTGRLDSFESDTWKIYIRPPDSLLRRILVMEDFGDHLVIHHSINEKISIPEMSEEFPDDEF